MKQLTIILILFLVVNSSCNDYLDAKPDKKLAILSQISDLWALLDNYTIMNHSSPVAGEEYSDNYYITVENYNAITDVTTRNNYIWADQGELIPDWGAPYKAVFYANIVLDEIEHNSKLKKYDLNEIKGSALFFRSFLFYELAQIFSKHYTVETELSPGIPLKLTSDINEPIKRPTLKETYTWIISDLKYAVKTLPKSSMYKNRPTKAAAYGALARVMLNMGKYFEAKEYADSCLQLYNTLMDFNTLSTTSNAPINRFNNEVIFASRSQTESSLLFTSRYKIDPVFYNSYKDNDLRKKILFKKNTDGSYTVKGTYDGSYSGAFFNGLAVDEQYLISAESDARLGNYETALKTLNVLMKQRYSNIDFKEFKAFSASEALGIILQERRKELFLRGLRWSDIRRLKDDLKYYSPLKRELGSNTIELAKDDKRYVSLIPSRVIERSNMAQNER